MIYLANKTARKIHNFYKLLVYKKLYNSFLYKSNENFVFSETEGEFYSSDAKYWAVFASFDKSSRLQENVIFYLKKLSEMSVNIIYVSTSERIKDDDKNILAKYCHKIIHRKNTGYDFGSWITGLKSIPSNYKGNIILCNDSVYGPLFSLADLFEEFEKSGKDAYGVTDSYEINYHMQSYFMIFKMDIINKYIKPKCLDKYKHVKSKEYAIWNGELALSHILTKNKVDIGIYCSYGSIRPTIDINFLKVIKNSDLNVNPTHFFWKELILHNKAPFLKKELLHDNPMGLSNVAECSEIVAEHTDYPVHLLEK